MMLTDRTRSLRNRERIKVREPGAPMVALLKLPKPLMNDTERRMFTRKQIQARVQSKRLDHTLPALRQPQVSLDLRDLSMGGLSALSDTPLERGERVAVFFPPQGALRGWG